MGESRIIACINLGQFFHKILVLKDGQMQSNVGVTFDNLAEVIAEASRKYDVHVVDICGPRNYCEKIGKDLQEYEITKYSNNKLEINYVED